MKKKFSNLIALTGALLSLSTYAGEKLMSIDALDIQVTSFEKKISYDAALKKHVDTDFISIDWAKVPAPHHLLGWNIVGLRHNRISSPVEQEEWKWGYSNQSEGMDVQVVSYYPKGNNAIVAIRNFVHRSNMIAPPYEQGPSDLGTISIQLAGAGIFEIHWAYANLQFSVEGNDKSQVLKTAYWLTKIAKLNTINSAALPMIMGQYLTPKIPD